jgi:hypothetical protein
MKNYYSWKMRMSFLMPVVVIGIIVCLGACTKNDAPPKTIPAVTFDVNALLLGDSVVSKQYGITFFVPKNWKPLPKDIEQQLRSRLSDVNTGEIRPEPLYIFVGEANKATLAVSVLRFPAQDTSITLQRMRFVQSVKSNTDSSTLRIAEFRKNTMLMTQCVIRTPERISFKVLVEAKNALLQFDYVLSMAVYTKEIRAVESSIGSILLIQ